MVGKGEIACCEQFLLFPQCFQKRCFPGVSKGVIVWEWVNVFCFRFCFFDSQSKHFPISLKVALQIMGRKFYKSTIKASLYSQSLLIFTHKTPAAESHPTTRQIRDLLWPRLTPMGITDYLYLSSALIYRLKIHRRSFKHSVR